MPRASRGGRPKGTILHGSLVKSRRLELGLTQAEIADLAGVTLPTVGLAERGSRIALSSARQISVALGVPLVQLLKPSRKEVAHRLMVRGFAAPAPPSPWAGGTERLRDLPERFRAAGSSLVWCVCGPNGIGKSALAARIASELVEDFPEGVVWVTAPHTRINATFRTIQLGISEALRLETSLPPPGVVGELAFDQALRSQVWARKRLVVVDDLLDMSVFDRLFEGADQSWGIVTTSSRAVADRFVHRTDLGPLSEAESVALLRAHIGSGTVEADPEGARALARVAGGVPRTLQIAGRVLSRAPHLTPREYAAELDDLGRSDPSEDEITAPWLDPLDPDATFAGAFRQVRRLLSKKSWEALGALSVFGRSPFPTGWAGAAMGMKKADATRCLDELANLYLLEEITAEIGSDRRSPWFRLDSQACRVAKWAGRGSADQRLMEFCADEVARLASLPTTEMLQDLEAYSHTWRTTLDRCAAEILPEGTAQIPETIDKIRVLIEPTNIGGPFNLLPEILANLSPWFLLEPDPRSISWLLAGLSVARHSGDSLSAGALARCIAVYLGTVAPDFDRASHWFEISANELKRAGDTDGVVRALNSSALLLHPNHGPGATLARLLDVVDLAEASGASDALTATLLCNHAALSTQEDSDWDWEPIRLSLQEAVALCRGNDEATEAIRSVCHVNLAMALRELGEPIELASLHEAVRSLTSLLDDDFERYRLGELARTLGVGEEQDPHEAQRRIWLLAPPEALGRRLQKLAEITTYLGFPVGGSSGRRRDVPGVEPPTRRQGIVVTVPFVGFPVWLVAGEPVMLYPLEAVTRLLDGEGLTNAIHLVTQAFGPQHPLLASLEGVGRARLEGRPPDTRSKG